MSCPPEVEALILQSRAKPAPTELVTNRDAILPLAQWVEGFSPRWLPIDDRCRMIESGNATFLGIRLRVGQDGASLRTTPLAAAVKALHERREQSRTANVPWPTIEEECRIVLEAGRGARGTNEQ